MTRFAAGGVIPARFSSADEVPVMLTPGEAYVIPVRFAAPGEDGDWTCGRCDRGQCARCRDEDCACCAGRPGE